MSDNVRNFIDQKLIISTDKESYIKTNDLYTKYIEWCVENKINKSDIRVFGKALKNNKIIHKHSTDGNRYINIKFK